MRSKALALLVVPMLLAAVACGKSVGTTSPTARDGILLKASDLAGLRLAHELPANVVDFTNITGHGDLFKDDPPVAQHKLEGFGFKRAYAEDWQGAGLQAAAFMAEFDTEANASSALAYMKTELFRPCPGEPTCSSRVPVSDTAIPNLVGQALTPLRPANEGRHFTLYKFVFRIGATIFGMEYGGDDAYDPGSVSQQQAMDVAEALYGRVKGVAIAGLFRGTPPSPLGAPPDGGPPPGGGPSPSP